MPKEEKKILERNIAKYLRDQGKKYKAEVRKLEWTNRRDAPDYLVMLNGPHFVETKKPGEVPRPSQKREFELMRSKGVPVHVLDTFEKVDYFYRRIAAKCEF